ncbi:uncharacterized protein Z520_12199 [Fonsecaea multimorphosa CBS 102226]|uniref:Protein kinase domain-containing protein n=1 Tax=Fonsecaea multimorphosa CBS 102226 TaxID=1442371 RepID=A0A0D2GRF4_9EURO|nr:uncharacterized protein Z520_12199 [Fonsecaea multimorphosa CBS 102226]KIX92115.1 hypothetical protein Z520_12199 [Fonsecaea multimorphosa CBS 102226]OAL17478.1 hypothetical protein AYO22_11610 [Fonsecaea multimorphosa]
MAEWAEKLQGFVFDLPYISQGGSGAVFALDDKTVIKVAIGSEEDHGDHMVEREIYGRLGHHPRIVKCISIHDKGIILERLQYPLRLRLIELRQKNELPAEAQIFKWSKQTSEAMQDIHGKSVLQVDIGTHNLLLDHQDNIKLCDFAGSSIDHGEPTVLPGGHEGFQLFIGNKKPSIHTELYSLGCIIFEISTVWQPYHGKTDREIEELYKAGGFPDTDRLILGSVIRKCWTFQYSSADEVVDEIDRIMDEHSMKTAAGCI